MDYYKRKINQNILLIKKKKQYFFIVLFKKMFCYNFIIIYFTFYQIMTSKLIRLLLLFYSLRKSYFLPTKRYFDNQIDLSYHNFNKKFYLYILNTKCAYNFLSK